jgi:hypothetical protein
VSPIDQLQVIVAVIVFCGELESMTTTGTEPTSVPGVTANPPPAEVITAGATVPPAADAL